MFISEIRPLIQRQISVVFAGIYNLYTCDVLFDIITELKGNLKRNIFFLDDATTGSVVLASMACVNHDDVHLKLWWQCTGRV